MRKILAAAASRLGLERLKKAPWFNRHTFWLLMVLAAFFSAQAMTEPLPRAGIQSADLDETPAVSATLSTNPLLIQTQELSPTDASPSATPLPEELIANREQTNGIVAGTIILLLIVIVGTVTGIRARQQE